MCLGRQISRISASPAGKCTTWKSSESAGSAFEVRGGAREFLFLTTSRQFCCCCCSVVRAVNGKAVKVFNVGDLAIITVVVDTVRLSAACQSNISFTFCSWAQPPWAILYYLSLPCCLQLLWLHNNIEGSPRVPSSSSCWSLMKLSTLASSLPLRSPPSRSLMFCLRTFDVVISLLFLEVFEHPQTIKVQWSAMKSSFGVWIWDPIIFAVWGRSALCANKQMRKAAGLGHGGMLA